MQAVQSLLVSPSAVPATVRAMVAKAAELAHIPPQNKRLADAVLERLLQSELERARAVDATEGSHQHQAARLQQELREVRSRRKESGHLGPCERAQSQSF